MRYAIIALSLTFTGCATVSEYNQGCRDGVNTFVEQGLHAGIDQNVVEKGCDGLDAIHQRKNSPKGKAGQ